MESLAELLRRIPSLEKTERAEMFHALVWRHNLTMLALQHPSQQHAAVFSPPEHTDAMTAYFEKEGFTTSYDADVYMLKVSWVTPVEEGFASVVRRFRDASLGEREGARAWYLMRHMLEQAACIGNTGFVCVETPPEDDPVLVAMRARLEKEGCTTQLEGDTLRITWGAP